MMRQLFNQTLQISLLTLILIGCATRKKTTTASKAGKYSEDLSVWRPKAEVVVPETEKPTDTGARKSTENVDPKYTVNKRLDSILDSIDRINVQRNFIDGFTIQIYSGLKREDALNAKKQITSSLPDLVSDIQYSQPNFRVKVGKYFNRIDAQRDFVAVKKYFPSAIVIPDKVSIN